MSYILIIGVFESLFLILLLLGKRNKSRSDLFLGLIFLLYALSIGITFVQLYNIRNGFPFPLILNVGWLVLFLHGPALWFYIKSLTLPHFKMKPVYLLHLIPFIGFLIMHYLDFMHLPTEQKIEIIKHELFKDEVAYKISVLGVGVSTLSYNIWALLLIRSYRHRLKQRFSRIEDIDLDWLRILTIASITVYAVNVALYNLDLIFNIAPYRILMLITYSFATVYVLVLGYFGLQTRNIFLSMPQAIHTVSEGKKAQRLKGSPEQDFISGLMSFMENKKPFLDPELTLGKLSKMLGVKGEYLSEVLNRELHRNFFDFVNKHRVEEFKVQSLFSSSKHLSIMGIAYNCGFNSKASFYRAFKKFEGILPSQYIQKVS
ncbi:MAG: helix-turn-helix domain-containing protein [Bacteroidales bacterium]|nr:helix-turn-helix domain-containing protein [Bacteroidales bacterium]MCF8343645.1 helix-turn-helix domain-containing protein [Bacteroidales bacterium]MCF8352259.1 helix-turn-helix domain-containing protein [Bacteroidales bacterium]MCF8375175.1 helix-turn-helix domain-containing protein [Bacteroidales bacterium]MCF8400703.1 helix-turn-helix domain-containing protein [Bacteroidales bacterium]